MSLEDGHEMWLDKERDNPWLYVGCCISTGLQDHKKPSKASNDSEWKPVFPRYKFGALLWQRTYSARHERGGDQHTGFVICTVTVLKVMCSQL